MKTYDFNCKTRKIIHYLLYNILYLIIMRTLLIYKFKIVSSLLIIIKNVQNIMTLYY